MLYMFYTLDPLQALILYYCYEKFYSHAVAAAASSSQSPPVFRFLRAFGTLMQGKTSGQRSVCEGQTSGQRSVCEG